MNVSWEGPRSPRAIGAVDATGAGRTGAQPFWRMNQHSQRRANSVKQALLAAGVAETSNTTTAKGESEPAEPRPDGTREPLNRRAEVQITIGR